MTQTPNNQNPFEGEFEKLDKFFSQGSNASLVQEAYAILSKRHYVLLRKPLYFHADKIDGLVPKIIMTLVWENKTIMITVNGNDKVEVL